MLYVSIYEMILSGELENQHVCARRHKYMIFHVMLSSSYFTRQTFMNHLKEGERKNSKHSFLRKATNVPFDLYFHFCLREKTLKL